MLKAAPGLEVDSAAQEFDCVVVAPLHGKADADVRKLRPGTDGITLFLVNCEGPAVFRFSRYGIFLLGEVLRQAAYEFGLTNPFCKRRVHADCLFKRSSRGLGLTEREQDLRTYEKYQSHLFTVIVQSQVQQRSVVFRERVTL